MYCVSMQVCQEAIENSDLVDGFNNFLRVCDDEMYIEMLKISCKIAAISQNTCFKMLNDGVLDIIMIRLDPHWRTRMNSPCDIDEDVKNFDESLQLLSMLLETIKNAPKEKVVNIKPPGLEAAWAMRYVFRYNMSSINRRIDRNYTTAMILLLADLFPKFRLLQSGLSEDICTLSVATELGTAGTWAAALHFYTIDEDYEFKRMIIVAIYYCTKELGALKIVKEKHVILCLMKLLIPEQYNDWCPEYLCKIRYTALNVLERIMHIIYQDFIEINGIARILLLLNYFVIKPYAMDTLISCLKCLKSLLFTKHDDEILKQFKAHNAKEILRNIVNILYVKDLNTSNQKAMTSIFSIMALLIKCGEDSFSADIDICLEFMRRILKPNPNDILYDSKLAITIINYLWELAIFHDNNLIYFVKANGVYLLLDIIRDAPFPVKLVALGFLVEIAEEGTGIPYLVTWRNKKLSLIPLLLKIFREENCLIGVKTMERGVVEGLIYISYPIMGKMQREIKVTNNTERSPAIADMEFSCRPKLYAIIQLLNERHKDKVEIANEHYKLYGYDLTIDDMITKLVCENYLTLKLGEAWMEVKQCIELRPIEIVPFDQFLLNTMIKNYYKWGADIQKMQLELLKLEGRKEYFSEEDFYNLLREAKLGEALIALKELRYLAKCSEALFRMASNVRESYVRDSGQHKHITYNLDLNITNVVGQKLLIESDRIIDPFTEIPPSPVSLESNNVSIGDYPKRENSVISLDISPDCH
ncbi:PREDICTED: cilia- and flagella-associated protein 69-like [Nicrophorus vespilloides]|uniref:Cilia- and flagella-associated protein 69-like n=1 Tax=Nicrophorus vespilloides TaxID=110193 RepID=A0ABM1MIC7_NICVS|nr:PREDICTED: cilia- and flagella-associated protein 69-like [Nicrophorus vespilloides]